MGINIGILGYGNLGRGVELAVAQNPDMNLSAVLTRPGHSGINILTGGVGVYSFTEADCLADRIDVLILCGSSAADLPELSPQMALMFNIVDSFDNRAKISEHFARVDDAAKKGGKIGVISAGWAPGLFSVNRVYANAVLESGRDYVFWGRGVSQGHSDAVRRIGGVLDAKQYTVPVESTLDAIRNGEAPKLSATQMHRRECFVVAAQDADRERIENEIKIMPNFFEGYDTTVHFITQEEMDRNHRGIPHGGYVFRSGKTGSQNENRQVIEYSLRLGSNPEFTACVLVACARAAYKMNKSGQTGCRTMLDIPPAYLLPMSDEELREKML